MTGKNCKKQEDKKSRRQNSVMTGRVGRREKGEGLSVRRL